jgi:Uma2 family endonuclease
MQVELPELVRIVRESKRRFSDREHLAFLRANPELNVERTAQGEIVIVAPASAEAGYRDWDVSGQLANWADGGGRGKAFSPVEERRGIQKRTGEGALKGFALNPRPIWQGLR